MSSFLRVRPTFYACTKQYHFAYVPTLMSQPVQLTKGRLLYVPRLPGVSLFLHRHKRDWCISESTTGLRVATAPSRELLHGNLEYIIQKGVDYTRNAIEQRAKLPAKFSNPTIPC